MPGRALRNHLSWGVHVPRFGRRSCGWRGGWIPVWFSAWGAQSGGGGPSADDRVQDQQQAQPACPGKRGAQDCPWGHAWQHHFTPSLHRFTGRDGGGGKEYSHLTRRHLAVLGLELPSQSPPSVKVSEIMPKSHSRPRIPTTNPPAPANSAHTHWGDWGH